MKVSHNEMWIGMANDNSLKYQWVDQSPVNFTNWASGEPQSSRRSEIPVLSRYLTADQNLFKYLPGGYSKCVSMNIGDNRFGSQVGKWTENDCNIKNPFICKYKLLQVLQTTYHTVHYMI